MLTEKVTINRKELFLSFDTIKLESEQEIQEQNNQVVVYVKETEPTDLNYGEIFRNTSGDRIVFPSSKSARDYVIEELSRTLYPPNFLPALQYTKENVREIEFKQLRFEIESPIHSGNMKSVVGRIETVHLAANPPHSIGSFTIVSTGGKEENYSVYEIRSISRG